MDELIVVVDYGMGNLWSVQSAIQYLGYDLFISSDHSEINRADIIILPGVGSYRIAMQALRERKLDQSIMEAVKIKKRKLLGICLGMQLMAEHGSEDGKTTGLGLIPTQVNRFDQKNINDLKVPHIGWDAVHYVSHKQQTETPWKESVLRDLEDGCYMYFVHSYVIEPDEIEAQIGVTQYGGDIFCSVLKKNNITGVQFHPELSSEHGLKIYKDFLLTF